MKNQTTELTIKKEISPIVTQSEALVITDGATMTIGVEMLSKANKALDSITKERERITKPLNEALKAERSRWKPLEMMLDSAISVIRQKMSAYQSKAEKARLEAEQAIADRIKAGKGNLSVETAIKKIGELETPERKIETDAGSISFMSVKKFEVVELSILPLEFHLANDVLIRQKLKEGVELAGVKYWIEQVPRNSR